MVQSEIPWLRLDVRLEGLEVQVPKLQELQRDESATESFVRVLVTLKQDTG